MKKGQSITESQIRWSEIGEAAWTSAKAAAAAREANGKPMTATEIEARARNTQDREDIRAFVNGGNLGTDCKTMTRSELVTEINRQLAAGLYGKGSKAGYKKVQEIEYVKEHSGKKMTAKFDGTCSRCGCATHAGDTIYWTPASRLATCVTCYR